MKYFLLYLSRFRISPFFKPKFWGGFQQGMVWNGKWNGTEMSVWNKEDARMEWNGRLQEWNGKQSSILPYRFHTRFRSWHLQKNIYGY